MKKSIAIVGGGASALMLASSLDTNKFDITIYERNFAPGRKFLVAGDGGFNLTHSEDASLLVNRYTPASFFLPLIKKFNNIDFQHWLENISIPTYIGSSKRVFTANIIVWDEVSKSIQMYKVCTKNCYF